MTLLTPPESEDTLQAFYRRVRPIGWWGPIAAILEEKGATPINRLRSAFCLTLLTVSTLFSLLLGVGGALFGGVGNLLTCTLLIFIGLGLIPFWWRGIDQDTT